MVSGEGKLITSDRFETPRSTAGLLDRITGRIAALEAPSDPAALVGVALPGPVDRARGVLVRSVNLPFLQDIPIEDELAKRVSKKVVLMTDAEAATWGEYLACDSPVERFIHLRFGTGVACGVVARGDLQPTDADRRTHLPALVVDDRPDAPACICGLRGCLELFAGGEAIARHPIEEVAGWIVRGIGNLVDPPPYGRGSEDRVAAGSPFEKQHRVASAPRSDGGGDLTVVCLGGGVLAAFPALFDRVCEQWLVRQRGGRAKAELRPSRLGDDAGVVGAALLVGR